MSKGQLVKRKSSQYEMD